MNRYCNLFGILVSSGSASTKVWYKWWWYWWATRKRRST